MPGRLATDPRSHYAGNLVLGVKAGRYTANHPDGFIVLRINKLLKINEWAPVMRAAFGMTDEALKLPNTPLLNSNTVWSVSDPRLFFFVQH